MRVRLVVRGTVQGVGFRPFVHRAARERGLTGFVLNAPDAVHVEIQGPGCDVLSFKEALATGLPVAAKVASIDETVLDDREERGFDILSSVEGGPAAPVAPPDLATCSACLAEVRSENERRYRYGFTNCTACGPRFSVITGLPYDRRKTSMRGFTMCADCMREYENIDDRRHHAQPIACPRCGPRLSFLDSNGEPRSDGDAALFAAIHLVNRGGILALRGIGGFQLLCDATDPEAVARLRTRKRRPDKPLAVMFRDLAQLEANAELSDEERRLLGAPAAPIVLLDVGVGSSLAENVTAGRRTLGAVLAYTALHALLLERAAAPLVCTSGNLSGEPLCTTTEEAVSSLSSLADGILTHDRPIIRPLDDSVARVMSTRTVVIRRARGYTPRAVGSIAPNVSVLALGAHQKSTVTLGYGGALVPSQHLGDMDNARAREHLETTARELCEMFGTTPDLVACDLHPDYASSLLAEELSAEWKVPLLRVQHHHAHVAAVMAEEALGAEQSALGLAWDGLGLGDDGSLWGGEALVCRGAAHRRMATLLPFPLLGGDRAARDPRRSGLGLLWRAGPDLLRSHAQRWYGAQLDSSVRCLDQGLAPMCSSIGRLFDGVAAILGLARQSTFEAQAAMALEEVARNAEPDAGYPFRFVDSADGLLIGDTRDIVRGIVHDLDARVPRPRIARRFHQTLIDFGLRVAERAGIRDVVLCGGAFQNRLLAEGLELGLERAGFIVHASRTIPPNDGGISVGQAWLAALASERAREERSLQFSS